MEDIKNMSLEDFRYVISQYDYINTPPEKRYKKSLKSSQKDMIKYHKEHLQKNGKVI